MCILCDGGTVDDLLDIVEEEIDDQGYSVMPVGDGRGPGWAYTIGLTESFGQPELVMTNAKPSFAATAFAAMAGLAAAGEGLDTCDSVDLAGATFRFCTIHPWHVEHGLLNVWAAYYTRRGDEPVLRVRQVYTDDFACEEHRGQHLLLDAPFDVLGLETNRMSRRARQRAHRSRKRR
jgi:Domain of unknown function (DUF4262)